jgi:hypothetical protein
MKRIGWLFLPALAIAAGGGVFASGPSKLGGDLSGYNEPPSVSTSGGGTFKARINKDETEISYELSYALEGAVTQSHLHLGQRGVNGGITVFLCTNLGNGPAGTQACPDAPATISGTITAADVSPNIPATAAARTQGLNTGEFAELLAAIRAGSIYVNVHTNTWPGGEIRSQVGHDEGHHDDHDHDHDE